MNILRILFFNKSKFSIEKKHKLKIFKCMRNNINGGSIRCFVTHDKNLIFDTKEEFQKKFRIYLISKKE